MALGHLMVISVVSGKNQFYIALPQKRTPTQSQCSLFSSPIRKSQKKVCFAKPNFYVSGVVFWVWFGGSEKYARKLYEWYGSKFIVVGHRKRQKSTNKFRVNLKILVTRRRSFRCFLEAQLIFLTGQSWQHILKNMGPHGDPWVSMGTHGNPWGPMGTHGDSWEPMGTHGNP